MQRRTLFKAVISPKADRNNQILPSPPTGTLLPFEGNWTETEAGHLLRRTTFGFKYNDLKEFSSMSMMEAVLKITEDLPAPEPPLNYDFENDPDVALGETWVDAPHNVVNNSNNYRIRSLNAWTIGRLISNEMNIREKMTLFWHNHFVTANVNDARFRYKYINLFRSQPLGNFREITKAITIDPSMLRYLNGNQNRSGSPNENYARELLELFTIGKGQQVAPGDYTNYTEQDVMSIARVLTGWRDTGFRSSTNPEVGSSYFSFRHDKEDKILSHRFDNIIIGNEEENEYKVLIDIIFQKDEVARFISRKLYRWFVYYEIPDEVEQNIIEPMAQIIIANDYSIKEAIIALLSSNHFYQSEHIGCMIKNPMDFSAGIFQSLELPSPPSGLALNYNYWLRIYNSIRALQMIYFEPPSVAGWKAYYQEPSYYQGWLNSVTMPLRKVSSDLVILFGLRAGDRRIEADYLEIISQYDSPYDVNVVLNNLTRSLLPKPLQENQLAVLKEILIPGLPDFEWGVEYGEYIANPDNEDLKNALQAKLRGLVLYITRMPEFQLS